jgi:hypothetical protein
MDAAELSKVVAELKELSAGEGGGDARVQVRGRFTWSTVSFG